MSNYINLGLFLLLSSFLVSNAQSSENIVWQGGYDYVAIVPIDDSDYKKNDHPVKFSAQTIYNLLGSIQLTEAGDSLLDIDLFSAFSNDDENEDNGLELPANALFTSAELRKISGPISKALASARPGEDVTFSVSGRHPGFLGKSQLSTTARVFHKDNHLHLIFGEIYVDITKKYRRAGGTSDVPDRVDIRKLRDFRLKTGDRSKKAKLPVTLVTDNSHRLHVYKGKKRKDWLRINIASFDKEQEKQRTTQKREETTVQETNELQQQTRQINTEQEQLKRKVERLERLMLLREKASRKQTVTPAPATAPTPSKSLEERLTELKQLHEKGFINDEIYNDKVKKLLEEL